MNQANRILRLITFAVTGRIAVAHWKTRLVTALVVTALYVLCFVPLDYALGHAVIGLVTVPVAVAAGLLGLRMGIIAGFLAFPLNTLLLKLTGEPGWDIILREGGVPVHVALVVIGAIIGLLSDLRESLRQELAERKQAYDLLRQKDQQFRLLIENALDIITILNVDGTIRYESPSVERVLGYLPEELVGKNAFEFIHPEDAPAVADVLAHQVQMPAATPLTEFRFKHQDGSWRTLEAMATSVFDDSGVAGIIINARDISQRKQAEEALRRSEEEQRRLAEENALLASIGRIIGSSLDIDQVYKHFATELRKLIPYDRVAIVMVDKQKGILTNAYIMGVEVKGQERGAILPLEGSITGLVVNKRAGQLVQMDDVQELLATYPVLAPPVHAGIRSFLAAPLINKDQVIGALHIQSTRTRAYSQRDLKLAESIGAQIAGAIASSQLYAQLQRAEESERLRLQEMEALFDIARTLVEPGTFVERTTRVLDRLVRIVMANAAVLRLPDEKEQGLRLLAVAGNTRGALADRPLVRYREKTLTVQAFLKGEPQVVNDYQSHPKALPRILDEGVKSAVFLPIKTGGQTLGIISVNSQEANHFTPERVRILTAIADELGVLLENARLMELERLRSEELQALVNIANVLVQPDDFVAKVTRVLEELSSIAQVERVTLRIPDEKEHGLRLVAAAGEAVHVVPPPEIIPHESISGMALKDGQPVVHNDYPATPNPNSIAAQQGMKSGISVPIRVGDRTLAVVNLMSKHRNHFTPDRVKLLSAVADGIGVLLENARLAQQLTSGEKYIAQLQESRRRIVAAQEEVRREIAEQLHGPVQTRLFATQYKLKSLAKRFNAAPEELLKELHKLADEVDNIRETQIRQISHRLHPSIIKVGLVAALRSLRDQYEAYIPIELEFDQTIQHLEEDGNSPIPEQVRLTCYRVAQEALGNVVKHAEARRALVKVWASDDVGHLNLQVSDDGKGFSLENVKAGLGLTTMEDYLSALGGSVKLESAPGKGTTVVAKMPLRLEHTKQAEDHSYARSAD